MKQESKIKQGFENKNLGKLGEEIAVNFLERKGFDVIETNYKKKWGEIDIVARDAEKLIFFEVKTVSQETDKGISSYSADIVPEERVDFWKTKRLAKAISSYLAENDVSPETLWQCDVLAVFLDLNNKKAKIRRTENVLFE